MGSEQLPQEAERLAIFIGAWSVEGTLRTGDGDAPVSGSWTFDQATDGWGVRGVMETEIEGMGAFEEAELIGFDAATGQVHLFSMNRFAIRDHVGSWTTADQLTVEYEDDDGDHVVTEVITIDVETADRLVGRVMESADGETTIETNLVLTRQAR
jgi:hypothetical protein